MYILGLIELWIFVWIIYQGQFLENYYCSLVLSVDRQYWTIWFIVSSIGYYGWDLTVLLMYVYKICVLKKVNFSNANDKDISVIKRINYVLNKIIILTLCYEFFGIFTQIYLVSETSWKGLWMMFREFVLMTESVVSALMIYLMIEHNNEQYLKILKILKKSKLCCCFN